MTSSMKFYYRKIPQKKMKPIIFFNFVLFSLLELNHRLEQTGNFKPVRTIFVFFNSILY